MDYGILNAMIFFVLFRVEHKCDEGVSMVKLKRRIINYQLLGGGGRSCKG